jgi:hypothetical protein
MVILRMLPEGGVICALSAPEVVLGLMISFSLCRLWFEGRYVFVADVEELFEFLSTVKQSVGNLDVFLLNHAIRFAQSGFVRFQKRFPFFSREAKRKLALFAQIAEHMTVERV